MGVYNIESLFQKELEENGFAGANICVLQGGQIVYKNNFGYGSIENNKKVSDDTIFRIYSMGKSVCSLAAMILVERGQLDLLTPVGEYIPTFFKCGVLENGVLVEPKRPILVKDLFHMTSGLTYPDSVDEVGQITDCVFKEIESGIHEGKELNTLQWVEKIATIPLAFHPGEYWRYGTSADILGAIIEVISNCTLGEFYEKEIFKPLHMVDTGFFVPEEKYHRFSTLYEKKIIDNKNILEPCHWRHLCLTEALKQPAFESAGAGLVSTLSDFTSFAKLMLQGGKFEGQRIVSEASIKFLSTNQITEKQKEKYYMPHLRGCGYSSFNRVLTNPYEAGLLASEGSFGWDGWTGPYLFVDRTSNIAFVMMTQVCGYDNKPFMRKLINSVYGIK